MEIPLSENAVMAGVFADCVRVRRWRWLAGLIVLALPACGLQEYETLMSEAQKREKFFLDGEKYLAGPVKAPTHKVPDKDGKEKEETVANLFFRPPKGIQPQWQGEPRNDLLWRYPVKQTDSGFAYVELGLAKSNKEFAKDVLGNYRADVQTTSRVQEFRPPGYKTPLVFDTWEFEGGSYAYSVNVLRSNQTQVALVFVYSREQSGTVRPVIERSLQSLAVDQELGPALQRFQHKSPWQLKRAP
jgi:hypothetical protein